MKTRRRAYFFFAAFLAGFFAAAFFGAAFLAAFFFAAMVRLLPHSGATEPELGDVRTGDIAVRGPGSCKTLEGRSRG